MDKLSNKELMAEIVGHVGREMAIKLVGEAYNAEILSNRIGRAAPSTGPKIEQFAAKDLLRLALERVLTVCNLTTP